MGPIRGQKKKRKRGDKRADGSSHEEDPTADGDWWDVFSTRITGPLSMSKESNKFEALFKISRKTFNYICSLVRADLMTKNFAFSDGKPLSTDDQVAVALIRLSSGESLMNIGASFGMNHSTVNLVTWRFVEAMEERGLHHLRWPKTEAEMESIRREFESVHGLPNCCGAIGTTHIVMCLPALEPGNKVWRDHARNHSMVLQAVVDPTMRFRDIVTGWPGSMDEFLVLRNSGFFKLCEKGGRLNGKSMKLSEGSEVREYVVGDDSFPLLPWLLTPYQGPRLSESESEFNRRHAATRMVAERALARMKSTWKIVQGEMWRPDKHRLPRIILVCCLLHNIIVDMEDDEASDDTPPSCVHDAGYKQQLCTFVDSGGYALREKLCQHLSGRLPP